MHELATCCCMKYLQLKIWNENWFLVISTYQDSSVMICAYYLWTMMLARLSAPSMTCTVWLPGHASRAQALHHTWFVPISQWHQWLLMQSSAAFWICCELNWQTVLFIQLVRRYDSLQWPSELQVPHVLALFRNILWITLASSCTSVYGCDMLFITMNEPKKRIWKMDILAPVNASKETCVAMAARSVTVLWTMNTIVKNKADTKKHYTQCGMFCGQRNSLKWWPFKQLECLMAAWFKQERTNNAVISSSFLKEKALCIATRLGVKILEPLMACQWFQSATYCCVQNHIGCVQKCRLFKSGGMEKGTAAENYWGLQT